MDIKGNFDNSCNAMASEQDSEIVLASNKNLALCILVWRVHIEIMRILRNLYKVLWGFQEHVFGVLNVIPHYHGWVIVIGRNKIIDTFTFMQKVLEIIFTILEYL